MTEVLCALVAGAFTVGAWRLWYLHRSMAALEARVSALSADVEAELHQFWKDVEGLHEDHLHSVEARVRRSEAAIAQIAREHGLLARHVAWMEPWVHHWASSAGNLRGGHGDPDAGLR
jgi:hypothetical protein